MVISSKNVNGSLRYADIYDQHVRKIQIRPIAGRYQLVIAPNYTKGQFTQTIVNESFKDGIFAILDSRTKKSIIADTGDSEKIIDIAKYIAKLI